MTDINKPYIGRYAPSPTGPLHFGSLVAAVASYLDARSHDGRWLLRMEDLDKPREMPGAADDILRMLEAYGFEWDGSILYQSERHDRYQSVLDRLIAADWVYPCNCSRREVTEIARAGIEGPVYPGTCRNGLSHKRAARAWRFKTEAAHLVFKDQIQGMFDHRMQQDVGDFILKRADGQFAYQLAVVVDDADQGITHVVRGADLLNSTSRQILLQYSLHLPSPHYAHIPVVAGPDGQKLSKQTGAQAITQSNANLMLVNAMRFLGMNTPDELEMETLDAIWNWAKLHWHLEAVPRQLTVMPDETYRL
jgi:glutamyl-Q tRNA(Asp) synthetase